MSKKNLVMGTIFLLATTIIPSNHAFAARLIDLSEQKVSFIKSFSTLNKTSNFKEVSRSLDFNQTLHVRVKQTYRGYPVWGGDGVIHMAFGRPLLNKKGLIGDFASEKNTSLTGKVYEDLTKDLARAPSYIFNKKQAEFAMNKAIELERKRGSVRSISEQNNQIIVYIDEENKAHYAFYLSFYVDNSQGRPAIPTYILDAENLTTYLTWNNIKTFEAVAGGGFGGNEKMGKLTYGLPGGLAQLRIERNSENNTCYLKNDDVLVADYRLSEKNAVTFSCEKRDPAHNNLYWNGEIDHINGAYSPDNDAFYAGEIINAMYKTWYHVSPILGNDEKPILISMVTHSPNLIENRRGKKTSDPDNAYWNPVKKRMYFGDGKTLFYPLTSLCVSAHEISHGFTDQPKNSNLVPFGQPGGMGESFSDMACKAAEFYAKGENDWQIGPEIVKTKLFSAIRDMDEPTKDCEWLNKAGENECSIDKANQFKPSPAWTAER